MLKCINDLAGIGENCQVQTPIAAISGLFLTTPEFQFDTYTDFADEDKWKEGIRDGYIFPMQDVKDEENQNVEDGVLDTAFGDKVFQYEGKRGSMLKFIYPLDAHKVARDYSFKNWRVFKLDRNNNIRGTNPSGTVVKGFKLSYFRTKKQEDPSSDNAAYTSIEMQEANVNEYDKFGIYLTPDFLAADLLGVLPVTLVCGSIAANVFTATVSYAAASAVDEDGANPTVAVSGLVDANFEVIDQTGAVLTPTTDYTTTESATTPGEYTIDATVGAMTGGSCQVIPSTAALYKSSVVVVS